MSFDTLPSNVIVDVFNYIANDPEVSWKDLLSYRKTSRIFGQEVVNQLKNAKIEEKHYCRELRQKCGDADAKKVDTLTYDFIRKFLPKFSSAIRELYLTRTLMHQAATGGITFSTSTPLDNIEMLHMVVCSATSFTLVEGLSIATPSLKTLMLEYPKDDAPCSKCVPHQIDRFWDASQWDPTQFEKLAFVGFYPCVGLYNLEDLEERRLEEDYDEEDWDLSWLCCQPGTLGNMLDSRLFDCNNLIALDLRYAHLHEERIQPFSTRFPLLRELRLSFDSNVAGSTILGHVVACTNLEFLELARSKYDLQLCDSHYISQLQQLTRLVHLHIQLDRDCDYAAFAAFFRAEHIQLQKLCLNIADHPTSAIMQDAIEGNPGLRVLVIDVVLLDTIDPDTLLQGIASLLDLEALMITTAYFDKYGPPSSPNFFARLDPSVHTRLQVAALEYNILFTTDWFGQPVVSLDVESDVADLQNATNHVVSQLRGRFHGHQVNGRPVEILGANLKADYKHIIQNYPQFACCVEHVGYVGYDCTTFNFPWKNT